jgi:hypothetical protein
MLCDPRHRHRDRNTTPPASRELIAAMPPDLKAPAVPTGNGGLLYPATYTATYPANVAG